MILLVFASIGVLFMMESNKDAGITGFALF